jgi:hypothetical protein
MASNWKQWLYLKMIQLMFTNVAMGMEIARHLPLSRCRTTQAGAK